MCDMMDVTQPAALILPAASSLAQNSCDTAILLSSSLSKDLADDEVGFPRCNSVFRGASLYLLLRNTWPPGQLKS
jgi:hypothetical protein